MSDNSRVRVSIVGVVVVALFCTLLARLWFLQAGPENSLKVQAIVDSTRFIQTESPRGEILDRNGKVLVKDRASWAVTVDRDLPKSTATVVLSQLQELLKIPVKTLTSQYTSARQSPLEPAIVALDVKQKDRLSIMQDPQDYPGVHVMQLTVREYPQGDLAAQLLGYVGEVPADELAVLKKKKKGYETGDEIGRAGAEAAFESELRGQPRRETIEVDPRGQQVGAPVDVVQGAVGADVWLTIDSKVQRAAEDALKQGIESARTLQNENVKAVRFDTLKAPAGAAVVLDTSNGSVTALASYPTYSPSWWVGGISTAHYRALSDPTKDYPLIDRATQGVYAPGSTFKLVTSLAMAQNGIQDPNQYVDDNGSVRIQGTTFHNAHDEALGAVTLQRALTKSSDVYFYNVGYNFWRTWKADDKQRGLGIQAEARNLGFGARTGIELDEADGRVPDPAWKSAFAHANYKTAREKRENSIWYPYDNLSLAVGQGDLVATPLQLANAYATFANGGTLYQPHVEAKIVQDGKSTTTPSHAIRHVSFDPNLYTQMMSGFQGAIADPKGTAYQAFAGFPLNTVPVAGKTGTAQVKDKGDTSIFVGMFSAKGKQYVVAVVMEQAGFGAQSAAPVARRIIELMNAIVPPNAPPVQAIKQGND